MTPFTNPSAYCTGALTRLHEQHIACQLAMKDDFVVQLLIS